MFGIYLNDRSEENYYDPGSQIPHGIKRRECQTQFFTNSAGYRSLAHFAPGGDQYHELSNAILRSKNRYIDPLVQVQTFALSNCLKRRTQLHPFDCQKKLHSFF